MNRLGNRFRFRFAGPGLTCLLALVLASSPRPAAETVREMESARGTVRITIVPLERPAAPAAEGSRPHPTEHPAPPEAHEDSLHPVEAITDFTSLTEMAREAEAMLQVTYFDRAAREELKFPLKYSELRRYLRKHPLEYREGSLEDRNVALMGDLAGALRIRMLPPAGAMEKP